MTSGRDIDAKAAAIAGALVFSATLIFYRLTPLGVGSFMMVGLVAIVLAALGLPAGRYQDVTEPGKTAQAKPRTWLHWVTPGRLALFVLIYAAVACLWSPAPQVAWEKVVVLAFVGGCCFLFWKARPLIPAAFATLFGLLAPALACVALIWCLIDLLNDVKLMERAFALTGDIIGDEAVEGLTAHPLRWNRSITLFSSGTQSKHQP